MIDFHTHILPGMDDGCRDAEESLEVLSKMYAQGNEIIAATPHYYRLDESIESFLMRRKSAYKTLISEAEKQKVKIPQIILGAETAFFHGMARNPQLSELCYENTHILLLEMPFKKWGSTETDELSRILVQGITPVLAHVERYIPLKNKLSSITGLQIPLQINANSIINPKTRRTMLKLIKKHEVHALGSDCHNRDSRPPNMAEAEKIIREKIHDEEIYRLDKLSRMILKR